MLARDNMKQQGGVDAEVSGCDVSELNQLAYLSATTDS